MPVVVRKIIDKPATEKIEITPTTKTEPAADKQEMIDETRTLLKLIHQDFTIYMDRLQEITEQVVSSTEKEKKKEEEITKTPTKKKHQRTKDVEEIEFEIDNLLFNDDEPETNKQNN